jgi:DNA-binding response OmpR family regulator
VTDVLVATDADWIYDEVDAALGGADTSVLRVRRGVDVVPACKQVEPALVVIDLQIGNMGGMAAATAVRQEQEAGRLADSGVIMLLDRHPDVFLAQTCGADGWLIKPLDAFRVRQAAEAVLGGGTWFEGLPGEGEDVEDPVADVTDDAEATADDLAGGGDDSVVAADAR